MAIFGCASDEQLKLENFRSALKSDSTTFKQSDLKIFWGKYCLAMEQFIKEKGLFEEFQSKIQPTINFDCDAISLEGFENAKECK